jgi:galacturonosyltransferase
MKIVVLANSSSGLYGFRKELLEELLKEHEVYVCVPNGNFIKEMVDMGCAYIETEFSRHGTNPISELKILSKYKRILKEVKPNIVFTYTIKPNVYGGMACASFGIPYVANITGLGTAVENGGIMQKITLTLYRRGLKNAQKVFFQNTENRDFMLNHKVIKGAYDMLPGSGVNLSKYHVFDYPDINTVDFVFVGRLMKEKGIEQYLDAAVYIRKKYPYTRFHICGGMEQNYSEQIKRMQEQKIIIYHGNVNDMTEIYKMISCTIHPTYYPEGMSNVLLESCACGRPIITTNRSGCREIVDDGVNGYIVNQKDSNDLIAKIEKFLSLTNQERKMMGLAGRRKVEREFDRKIVVEKYLAELER